MTYVLLGLLGISLGLEPNESIGDISRWCERVSGGIFREPSNALSNIGFMIVGLLMFRVLIKDEEKAIKSVKGKIEYNITDKKIVKFKLRGTINGTGIDLEDDSSISFYQNMDLICKTKLK